MWRQNVVDERLIAPPDVGGGLLLRFDLFLPDEEDLGRLLHLLGKEDDKIMVLSEFLFSFHRVG